MPFATASDGTRLYFGESGSGEPLLLIQGNSNDHRGWGAVREDFAARHRVIVYDHRGTGQSDKPEDPAGYTSRQFARDALAILDAAGVERAHVYGVSMGGTIAQWLAIDHPDRVGALVLGCTGPGGPNRVPPPAAMSQALNEALRNPDPEVRRRAWSDLLYSPEWAEAHLELAASLTSGTQDTPPAMQRLHAQISPTHDAWDSLPSITAPTLVIHGSDDPLVPVRNAELLAERIPGAELHIVQGGRHGYMIEFREEASRVVLDFLAKHPIAASRGAAASASPGF